MRMKDSLIRIEGLRLFAYHGVLPQERIVGTDFTIDLDLYTDFEQAAVHDTLEATISYADIVEVVRQEMKTPSLLLEHVIYRIATALLTHFPTLQKVRVRLNKINPPMGTQADAIGVEAFFER